MKKITFIVLLFTSFYFYAQDTCQNASIVEVGNYTINGINGNPAPTNCINYSNGDNGEWYLYTPTEDVELTVSTSLAVNAGTDTRFHIYSGSCANLVCVGGDDDAGSGNTSLDSINVTAGINYYIVFDNRWSSVSFEFEISESTIANPPNDDISFTSQSVSTLSSEFILADLNGDFLDDVATTSGNNVLIHYQKSDATFDEVNVATPNSNGNGAWKWSVAAGDLDGNGYSDFLYGYGSSTTIMMANTSETSNPSNNYATNYTEFSPSIYVFSQRTNFIDINNDGLLDAFVCHDVAPNVYFINNGDGTFETHQVGDGNSLDLGLPGSNYATIWFDYDNDHDLDMYITKCTSAPNRMYSNNGDGTYTDVTSTSGLESLLRGWSSAVGDFNNDGFMDILLGASSGANGLMINNGDGTFTDVTAGSGFDVFNSTSHEYIAEDFNNDGFIDILSSGTIMINNGDMTFTESANSVGQGAIGDANNDGFLDVFSGSLKINNNTVGNYININPKGTTSNFSGIGARVEITSSLGTQIRDIKSGVGFKHMSSLTAHFGLGADTVVESVTVYWPSGNVDMLINPTINESLIIEEGSAPLSTNENLLNELTLFPNPTTNSLTISSSLDLENSVLTIFDVQGKKVYNSFYTTDKVDVSSLDSGLYVLRIIHNNKEANLKFVKK